MSSAVRGACATGSSTAAARRAAAPTAAARATPSLRAMRTAATGGGNGAEPEQQQQQRRPRSLATLLVHSEGLVDDPFAASMPPIYQVRKHCICASSWGSMHFTCPFVIYKRTVRGGCVRSAAPSILTAHASLCADRHVPAAGCH